MIEAKSVTKKFGDKAAVKNISFAIKKGEIVGLLGPNGAGKTTTMRLLTGYLAPDAGDMILAGHSITREPLAAQAKIGYMPENNPLYKDMLVSEFLKFAAALKNVTKKDLQKSFEFCVAATDIGAVFYKPINELSKGFRQRVGLAAALLHKPEVLILDEPTEGLDPNQRTDVRTLIKKLAKNQTVMISTHVLQEAQAMCDRLLIINQGELVADGTTAELMRGAQGERRLKAEIEGKEILETLRGLEGVVQVASDGRAGDRLKVKIIARPEAEIPPALSQVSAKLGWTIWHLSEEAGTLEDIFKDLTQ